MERVDLTPNFSLQELTVTSDLRFQGQNRILTGEQVGKLRELAQHCEKIRSICGDNPVRIHSGYRSIATNQATVGSSSTSQHPRCEAVDFDIPGQTVNDSFNSLLTAARAGNFTFGQLILEQADRLYEIARWVHCSVPGTLEKDKIGQVLSMNSGTDGKPSYFLIEKLNFTEA